MVLAAMNSGNLWNVMLFCRGILPAGNSLPDQHSL